MRMKKWTRNPQRVQNEQKFGHTKLYDDLASRQSREAWRAQLTPYVIISFQQWIWFACALAPRPVWFQRLATFQQHQGFQSIKAKVLFERQWEQSFKHDVQGTTSITGVDGKLESNFCWGFNLISASTSSSAFLQKKKNLFFSNKTKAKFSFKILFFCCSSCFHPHRVAKLWMRVFDRRLVI